MAETSVGNLLWLASGTGSVGTGKGTHSHLSLQGLSMAAEKILVAISALKTFWDLETDSCCPHSDLQTCSVMTAFG